MSIIATAICPLPVSMPRDPPREPATTCDRPRARVDMRHTLRCRTVEARVEGAMPRARVLLWPTAWAAALATLLLGGALGPGFVLSYDMVWVPDLGLGPDALGL